MFVAEDNEFGAFALPDAFTVVIVCQWIMTLF